MNGTCRLLLTYCLCLLAVSSISAQSITVVEETTLRPIANVYVYNKPTGFSATTNKQGKFNLPAHIPDSTHLHFQHSSYYSKAVRAGNLINQYYKVHMTFKTIPLGEVVVSASKDEEAKEKVPNRITTIQPEDISFQNPQTSADMLEQSGNIFIQRSQMGGGSPVIRGFEANKVLIVVDGVRMNNAIFRSGHLQNVITIDPAALDKTEILYGPGSVIYGSDALGGVMHLYTRDPAFSHDSSLYITGQAYGRFATANNEKSIHIDANIGGQKLASFTSFTIHNFEDLRTGHIRNPFYGDWGKRKFYATRINGRDTMLRNTDKNIQRFTGYSQLNLIEKLKWKAGDNLSFVLNTQYTTSTNIPRYDRLNNYNGDTLEYAEWYYGPQKHFRTSLETKITASNALFDELDITAAYQKFEEDRITRKFGQPLRRHRAEDVTVYSLNVDFEKQLHTDHRLHYGFQGIYNPVESTASGERIDTNITRPVSTRYPDGDNLMQTYAAYLSYKWDATKRLTLNAGARYSRILLHSTFEDTTFYDFPFKEININKGAMTGNAGLTYRPGRDWQINLMASSGFRAPNVDDAGKIFDSSPGSVMVPNNDLGPEYAYNADLGIEKIFYDIIALRGRVFYTLLTNAIVRRDHSINGKDSIIYDGTLSRVQANVNAGQASIKGVSVNLSADITPYLSFKSDLTHMVGRDLSNDVPLGHIPPTYGHTSVLFHYERIKSEFYMHYNGWKRLDEYSPAGEDNLEEATRYGTPAWYTLNLRAAYQFNDNIRFQAALENMLDHHYRPFSSGVSAPGRNLILTVRGQF